MGLMVVMVAAVQPAPSRAGVVWQGDCQTFSETGKTMCGKFRDYWNKNGGLPQQGFPISEEFQEVSEVDGKTYTVQYFERAVFEAHPENQPPHDVLLSLLGSQLYAQKYPNGAPSQQANQGVGSTYFEQTQHYVGGLFNQYWKTHGGLAQQGYPISEEFQETSELDGKTYKVQYFERAVFEYHPEQQAAFQVLLSQLGTSRYKQKYAGGTPPGGGTVPTAIPQATRTPISTNCTSPITPGVWAGPVNYQFSVTGANISGSGVSKENAVLTVGCEGNFTGTVNGTEESISVRVGNQSVSCTATTLPTIQLAGKVVKDSGGLKLSVSGGLTLKGAISCQTPQGTRTQDLAGIPIVPLNISAEQVSATQLRGTNWIVDPSYQAMIDRVTALLNGRGSVSTSTDWVLNLQGR